MLTDLLKWIGTTSSRIRFTFIISIRRDNILNLRPSLLRPSVKKIINKSDYEKVVCIKMTQGTYSQLMSSAKDFSIALKSGKLKNWEVMDIRRLPGGNLIDFTLIDASHSFRYSVTDLSELNNEKIGSYSLQEGHDLNFIKRPHLAILGQTGSGKSYLMTSLVYQYIAEGSQVYTIDPKNAELAKISDLLGLVYSDLNEGKPSPVQILDIVIAEMDRRQSMLATIQKITVNAIDDLDLKPVHLVVEEVTSCIHQLPKRLSDEFINKLEIIARKGRSAGVYLTVLTQTFTAVSFGTSAIREQIGNVIALGPTTKMQRSMIVPDGLEAPEVSFGSEYGIGLGYFDGGQIFKVESPTIKNDVYSSLIALAK